MAVVKRIRKLKTGKKTTFYQAELYVGGQRLKSKSFDTQAAAYAWIEAEERLVASGRSGAEVNLTFGQCLSRYRVEAFPLLRKSSQQARESRLRYLEAGPMVTVRMSDLGPRAVDEWLWWLRKHATATTKMRRSFVEELKLLSTILRWYRESVDLAFVVPIGKKHRRLALHKPEVTRRPDYYVQPEDVLRWLAHLRNHRPDPVYYRLGLFMVLTGFRLGEAAGLCWDAVDLGPLRQVARVVRTLNWDYRTKAPYFQHNAKTASSIRFVALPPVLVEMFKEIGPESVASPAFLNSKGKLLSDNAVRDNFNAAFKACGLPWTGSHIARHTSATLGLIATRDLPAMQAQLGHSSARQTQQYAKVIALHGGDGPSKTAELIGLNHVRNHVQTGIETK